MSIEVVVDDREPAAVVEAVESHADVDAVSLRRLDAGDVFVGAVGVERKTLGDYVNALIGRSAPDLFDQVRRLAGAYEHAYLLLEDQFPSDGDEGVPAAAVRGSAASITARHDVPVIPCSDRARLVDVAVRLGRKHGGEPSTRALGNGAVPARDVPSAKRMYGCIEGVGPEVAGRLHEAYPAVADLLAASREELLAVPGVGEKRAEAIDAALRSGRASEAGRASRSELEDGT